VTDQLAFDLPRHPADLSDLDLVGHKRRLAEVDRERELREGIDFQAPTAPTCRCHPRGVYMADDWDSIRCVHCGKAPPS
jgi:hypothetical protein